MAELQAVSGIRSMLAARTSIEGVLARDVGRLLPSRRIEALGRSLGAAADDARRGAGEIADIAPDAARRLEEAAGVLDGVRALGADRASWNARLPEVSRARDLLEESIVETRATLAHERAEGVRVDNFANRRFPYSSFSAEEWGHLADQAELPIGLRPLALEHVGPGDVKLLREQAARMRGGLSGSRDPRLRSIMDATRLVNETTTRADTEELLRRTAAEALEMVDGTSSDRRRLGDLLATIAGLQRLDGTLRPRMLARTTDVDWDTAALLLGREASVPPSWDGFRALRRIAHLEHPQSALEQLIRERPEGFTAPQWRKLAQLVRLPAEERPAELAGFSARQARQMETVARMVSGGSAVPASWKGFSEVNRLRANVLWASAGLANEHLAAIARLDPGDVTRAHFSDLDALRQLPDAIRPSALDPSDTRWAVLAASDEPLTAAANAESLDAYTRLATSLRTPDELRATFARVDEHVAELERIQTSYSEQAPRAVLNAFAADLRLLGAFEHGKSVSALVDQTEKLVAHNIDRLDGNVRGGYGRHVDYADMGRIKENVRMFTELSRERILGESDTLARARQAREATQPAAAPSQGVVDEATEVLEW